MVDLVRMLTERKGDDCTFRPVPGTTCLVSGPNCDDDNGYTYGPVEILWADDLFVVYRVPGCWPVVNKWEHIRSKPLPATTQPEDAA